MRLDKQPYPSGVIYELVNDRGVSIKVTNYGCIILSIVTPDRQGVKKNIVAGFETIPEYIPNPDYLGCIIGRVTSRTSGAGFTINGQWYQLSANKGRDHLHGGSKGFDQRYWDVKEEIQSPQIVGVVFSYCSPALEEGYPGGLDTTVGYFLNNDNRLTLRYQATADRVTPVNLTHHSYFNLTGFEEATIDEHSLQINAERYTPLSASLVPSGEILSVRDTALDFNRHTPIGLRMKTLPEASYDHNYVLDKPYGEMGLAAEVLSPSTGRMLRVYSDQPCLGLYTSGYLDGTRTGTQGKSYVRHGAVCLETQQYPDAVNRPEFPSTLVEAGGTYNALTVWEFGIV
ncbi:MAG TPA: aldose epimerase family protein [Puia sp.]|nr:aldose epimerase family protein [Puia sp.]